MTSTRVLRVGLLLAAAASTTAIAAGSRWHFTRPRCQSGVPRADYQYGSHSVSLTLLSLPARDMSPVPEPPPVRTILPATENGAIELLPPPVAATEAPRDAVARPAGGYKLFQWPLAGLRVDHCTVSQLAFWFDQQGRWTATLRGDQNPLEEIGNLHESTAPNLFTSHVKRNQFHVRLRVLGVTVPPRLDEVVSAGRPVLAAIDLEPFWVERQVPEYQRQTGCDPNLGRYFELIDRVEIEFFYR